MDLQLVPVAQFQTFLLCLARVIALVAAVFGFGGIAAGAVGIAKVLFFVFVIMAVVSFIIGLLKKN